MPPATVRMRMGGWKNFVTYSIGLPPVECLSGTQNGDLFLHFSHGLCPARGHSVGRNFTSRSIAGEEITLPDQPLSHGHHRDRLVPPASGEGT